MEVRFSVLALLSLAGGVLAEARVQASGQPPPNARFASLADNTAVDLGSFNQTVPWVEGNASYHISGVTDYSGFVYDADNHRMLMFGGGHATVFTDAIYAFDFQTLRWAPLYTATPVSWLVLSNLDRTLGAWKAGPSGPYPRPISRHTYDLLAAPRGLGQFIVLASPNGGGGFAEMGTGGSDPYFLAGAVAHYGFAAGAWSFSGWPGDQFPHYGFTYPACEVDPVSGKILIVGRAGIHVYDPVSRAKAWVVDNLNRNAFGGDVGYANHLVYYPPNRKMYYFNRNSSSVWELTIDRADFSRSTLVRMATTGSPPPPGELGYDYDAVNQVIGGGVTGNRFYVFDPRTASWSSHAIQGGFPGNQAFHALGYNPVDNVFLFITDLGSGARTWAYRYKNGTTPAPTPTPPAPPPPASAPQAGSVPDREGEEGCGALGIEALVLACLFRAVRARRR
jgi:hypothetical protein